jgi:hypothetical protein
MKNHTKKIVASALVAGILLTSFSAAAVVFDQAQRQDTEIDKKKNIEKTTKEALNKAKVTVEITEEPVTTSENEEADNFSFCIGDCDDENHKSRSCDDDDDKCEKVYRFFKNKRDGFYVDVSALSSFGDDYGYGANQDTDTEFDVVISYRVQLLGLFMESPGISTRRIQGMYAMPAWGVNFYNSDDYSFDLFYQYSTRGIEGLSGIQTRNQDERAGIRMTGFYDNSQLQVIYSPVSRNSEGSDGIEASISYSYNVQYRNINFYSNLGMQYRSKEVTPYGVSTFVDDKLSTSAGISYSAEVGLEYPLTTDWVIGSYVGYNALSDRSIAARQDTIEDGTRGGLLLTYVF